MAIIGSSPLGLTFESTESTSLTVGKYEKSKIVGDENLYKLWKNRLEQIVHEFSGFEWGMENFIVDEYYSIPWIEED